MKSLPLLCLALVLGAASPLAAAVSLSSYTLAGTYALPTPEANETSAIAWDRASNTLFVMGDSASYLVQMSLTGQFMGAMSLNGFADTEALASSGPGTFIIGEERIQTVDRVTYHDGAVASQSLSSPFALGGFAGNDGIEGITLDPLTGDLWAVKEKNNQAIYQVVNYAGGGTSVITNPFSPSGLGLGDLSDIYALSNSHAFDGTSRAQDFFIISQQSNLLVEVNRSGQVVGSLDLSILGKNDLEGVTMDDAGNLYITSESPTLYVFKPAPEASSALLALAALPVLLRRKRA